MKMEKYLESKYSFSILHSLLGEAQISTGSTVTTK